MKRNRTYNSIFRRTVTTVAALAMLLSCVPHVGETWAWFNDNQNTGVGGIRSATFRATVSISEVVGAAETTPDTVENDGVKVDYDETNARYSATLTYGKNYTITITPAEGNTASSGYCLIESVNGVLAVAKNVVKATYQQDYKGKEGMPVDVQVVSGFRFILSLGAYSDNTAESQESQLVDLGVTEIPDEAVPATDGSAVTDTFYFTPTWGTYGSVSTYDLFGPVIIENGATVNEWCEAIDPSTLVLRPTGTESSGPAYVAVSEHNIPLYYQNDYPDIRYGAGSVATSGCGIISLAMIANYMTGYTYDPVDLARWFGGRAENNIQRMLIGAETLGIPYTEAANIDEMTAALYSGKIVVMMQDGFRFENPFTTSQHFLVVRGITEDGRYLILDPNKLNYDKWQLKEGFEKGFTRSALAQGYSGAWIFDPEAIPEDYVPYHKEEPVRQDNYPGVELTYAEQEMLAKLIWAEARGECAEGQQAVAEVVLNRLVSGLYQKSIESIIYAPGQFNGVEKMDEAEPWQAQYDAIDAARYGTPVLEKDVFYFGTAPHNDNIFKQIGGHIFCYADSSNTEPDEETKPDVFDDQDENDVTEPEVEQPEPETQAPESVDPQPEETDKPELGDEDYEGPGLNVGNYYQSESAEDAGENAAEPIDSDLVSLAMVATYITRHEYLPATLASWFDGQGENSSQRLGIAADTLKLPWVTAEDMSHVTNAIADGNLVILMMDGTEEANIFTDKEHFVVLRGVTEDGKYLINDPDKANYGKDELMEYYENGFDLETISAVYRSAWIFNPNALPEGFTPYEQDLTAPAANQEWDAQVSDEEQSETSE